MLSLTLTALLVGLTLAMYHLNDEMPVAPAVLFCAGFSVCSLVATLYAGRWNYVMGPDTFLVVFCGILIFCVTCLLTHRYIDFKYKKNAGKHTALFWSVARSVDVSFPAIWRLVAFAAVQVGVFLVTLYYVQQMSPDLSLVDAIARYNGLSTFSTEDVSFPSPFRQTRGLVVNGGYVVAFLAGTKIAHGFSKESAIAGCCLALSMVLTLELGNRTDLVILAICAFSAFCLERKRSVNGRVMNRRTVLLLIALVAIGLLSFRFLAVGRDLSGYGILDYLAEYLGAEIPNLDAFVSNQSFPVKRGLPGYMTLIGNYGYLGEKLGIAEWIYPLDLPFQTRNGFDMGNVYTTFYPFLYDAGVLGLVVFTIIMAFLSQLVFEAAVRYEGLGSILGILYGVVAPTLALSFFSNKFYETFYIGFVVAFGCMIAVYTLLVIIRGNNIALIMEAAKGVLHRDVSRSK